MHKVVESILSRIFPQIVVVSGGFGRNFTLVSEIRKFLVWFCSFDQEMILCSAMCFCLFQFVFHYMLQSKLTFCSLLRLRFQVLTLAQLKDLNVLVIFVHNKFVWQVRLVVSSFHNVSPWKQNGGIYNWILLENLLSDGAGVKHQTLETICWKK